MRSRALDLGQNSQLWSTERGTGLGAMPRQHPSMDCSVHPLSKIVAGLQFGRDLFGGHCLVLRQVLGVFPLEKLDSVLCNWLPPEMAVCSSLLILGLAERQ